MSANITKPISFREQVYCAKTLKERCGIESFKIKALDSQNLPTECPYKLHSNEDADTMQAVNEIYAHSVEDILSHLDTVINLDNPGFLELINKNKQEDSFLNVIKNTAEYISQSVEDASQIVFENAHKIIFRNNLLANNVDLDLDVLFNGFSHVFYKKPLAADQNEKLDVYFKEEKINETLVDMFHGSANIAERMGSNFIVGANNGLATIMGLINTLKSKCSEEIAKNTERVKDLISNTFRYTVDQFSRMPMALQNLMQSEWGIKSRLDHIVFPINEEDFEIADLKEFSGSNEEKLALISSKKFLQDTINKYHDDTLVWGPTWGMDSNTFERKVVYEKLPLKNKAKPSAGCVIKYLKTKSGKTFFEEFNKVVQFAVEESVVPFFKLES